MARVAGLLPKLPQPYRQPVSRIPGGRPADWFPELSRCRRPISSDTPSDD
jgi:hypothetical protein